MTLGELRFHNIDLVIVYGTAAAAKPGSHATSLDELRWVAIFVAAGYLNKTRKCLPYKPMLNLDTLQFIKMWDKWA